MTFKLNISSNCVSYKVVDVIFNCLCDRSYHQPLAKEDLKTMSRKHFSDETNKKIRWVVNMFDDWRNYQNSQDNLDKILFDFNDETTISRQANV